VAAITGAGAGGLQFHPKVLTAQALLSVRNKDVLHTVTSDTNVFDSGSLSKGEEFSLPLPNRAVPTTVHYTADRAAWECRQDRCCALASG
jgi:hypothetical protein